MSPSLCQSDTSSRRTTLCPQPLEQSRGDLGVRYQPVEQVLAYLLSPLPTLDFCFVTLFNAT